MKKRIVSVMLSALLLTGCGETQGAEQFSSRADHTPPESSESEYGAMPEAPSVPGIHARTEQSMYPADIRVIRLLVTNDNDESWYLPESFRMRFIYPLENGYEWDDVPYSESGDSFTELAQEVPAHGEATVILDLAAHFDLPLEDSYSGFYRIEIGGISADFQVGPQSAAPQEPQPQEGIYLDTELEYYPADTKEISVRFINDSTADFTYCIGDFGLEQFLDGAVAYAPFSPDSPEARETVMLAPGDCEMRTLRLADFPGMQLQPGEFAFSLSGLEARFTVTES